MSIIYGKNPVMELLKDDAGQIDKVLLHNTLSRTKITDLLDLCKQHKVRFDFLPPEKLDQIAGNGNHQGIVAYTSEYKYTDLEDLDLSGNSLVVILDLIEDPHNLGAVIRSAAGAGANAVIIQDRNCAQVNETVIKVSAGTAHKIPVVRATNLSRTIEKLKKDGFWIVGTDMDGDSDYNTFEFPEKTCLVIGNEGKGMRQLVKLNCDFFVKIPLRNGVESLNASVAAGLLLFTAAGQIFKS